MKELLCLAALVVTAMSPLAAEELEYTVREGDTPYSIAHQFGVNLAVLLESNNIEDPTNVPVGRALRIPEVYLVRKNETLWGIARAYGMTPEELREINGLDEDYVLKVGDRLTIPGMVDEETALVPEGMLDPKDATADGDLAEEPAPQDETMTVSIGGSVPFWPHEGNRRPRNGKLSGTEILGDRGDPVYAVAAGRVVWKAPDKVFGGELVIIENEDGFQYVYGGTDAESVERDQRIEAGTEIGHLGVDPNTGEARVFFTIMKNGRIVDAEHAPRG